MTMIRKESGSLDESDDMVPKSASRGLMPPAGSVGRLRLRMSGGAGSGRDSGWMLGLVFCPVFSVSDNTFLFAPVAGPLCLLIGLALVSDEVVAGLAQESSIPGVVSIRMVETMRFMTRSPFLDETVRDGCRVGR